jgi:hypothetical protein
MIGRDPKGTDIGNTGLANSRRRHRDQPGQSVHRAEALRHPVVPGEPIENQTAALQPHQIEARLSLR